jgi:hypothetical protein
MSADHRKSAPMQAVAAQSQRNSKERRPPGRRFGWFSGRSRCKPIDGVAARRREGLKRRPGSAARWPNGAFQVSRIVVTAREMEISPVIRLRMVTARQANRRYIYDGSGKRRVRSRTLPRIRARASASSLFSSASASRSEISSISSSFMPRVVTAGVPTRIPPGLKIG